MGLRIAVGTTSLDVVPFERFDDFKGFSAHWAGRLVPGPARLNRWDAAAGTWEAPRLEAPIVLRPALQCLVTGGFGERDPGAERAMMARICAGLNMGAEALHAAVEAELPPARFAVDTHGALSPEQQAAGSWEVMGQAHYDHLVLRGPVGRLGDWILLSVAIDFTLSVRAVSEPVRGPGAASVAASGALTDRMPEYLQARSPQAFGRAGLRARP